MLGGESSGTLSSQQGFTATKFQVNLLCCLIVIPELSYLPNLQSQRVILNG